MKKISIALAILLFAFNSTVLMAQMHQPHSIHKEQVHQQKRIDKSIRNGELTKRETHRLHQQQKQIQHDKRLAKADGVVTPQERRFIKREQASANRTIARKKHNSKGR